MGLHQGGLAATSVGAAGVAHAAPVAEVIPAPVDEITSLTAACVAIVAGLLSIARSPQFKRVVEGVKYLWTMLRSKRRS